MKAAVVQVKGTFEGSISERRACRLLKLAASTFRYRPQANDNQLREELIELSRARPWFGLPKWLSSNSQRHVIVS